MRLPLALLLTFAAIACQRSSTAPAAYPETAPAIATAAGLDSTAHPDPSLPDVIYFSDGSILELKDGALQYERRGHPLEPPRPRESWSTRPTVEQLAAFWARLDSLHVWTFGDRTAQPWEIWGPGPNAMDGRGWHLTLRHGGRELDVKGYNEGPRGFAELKAALHALAGRSDF